jgi:SAM-dependent methyltransferase
MSRDAVWDDWLSAEAYREYAERYPLYPALNYRLAQLADLRRARRVLDLGCGTGETSAACLRHLPVDAEILGLDSAATMVEIARCRVGDPRARFLCASAAGLTARRLGRFDRVVCNAASWLFPSPAAVLSELRDLIEPDGLMVFNIPAERVVGEGPKPHPFQLELAASLMTRLPGPYSTTERQFTPEGIKAVLERCHFRIERIEPFRHVGRQQELMELMQIPAMAARLQPDLDAQRGLRIVEAAAARSDPNLEVDVPWIYFVARRQ